MACMEQAAGSSVLAPTSASATLSQAHAPTPQTTWTTSQVGCPWFSLTHQGAYDSHICTVCKLTTLFGSVQIGVHCWLIGLVVVAVELASNCETDLDKVCDFVTYISSWCDPLQLTWCYQRSNESTNHHFVCSSGPVSSECAHQDRQSGSRSKQTASVSWNSPCLLGTFKITREWKQLYG